MKPAETVNVHQAKTHLSRLLSRVERGETIVIARDGTPVAKLVRVPKRVPKPTPNTYKGQIWMSPDFDEMTEEELAEWGM
jgi:prevent-host-death family protein